MISLPNNNPDFIYEGLDPASWEDATGDVLNRAPKQIHDNVLALKAAVEATDSSVGNLRILNSILELNPPSIASNNTYITGSLDDSGVVIIANKNGSKWTFQSHIRTIISGSISVASMTSITSSAIGNLIGAVTPGQYIIQFTSGALQGYSRILNAATPTTVSWADALSSAPAVNDTFEVYQSTSSLLNTLNALADDSLINALVLG